jgi:hypothetical protein
MGPDKGLTCTIYVDFNCNNAEKHLTGFNPPGFPDYQADFWLINNQMQKEPMSYQCKKT